MAAFACAAPFFGPRHRPRRSRDCARLGTACAIPSGRQTSPLSHSSSGWRLLSPYIVWRGSSRPALSQRHLARRWGCRAQARTALARQMAESTRSQALLLVATRAHMAIGAGLRAAAEAVLWLAGQRLGQMAREQAQVRTCRDAASVAPHMRLAPRRSVLMAAWVPSGRGGVTGLLHAVSVRRRRSSGTPSRRPSRRQGLSGSCRAFRRRRTDPLW
jgi:hypothetical protein